MARENYEQAKSILKAPLRIVGITAAIIQPTGPRYDEEFGSLEEVYAFFRKKRPEGRWLIWVRDSNGQEIALDSEKWEKVLDK